jgi:hypothetical protein
MFRLLIVGLVTLMLVAACGTDDETAAEPPPAPPAESVPPTTAASEEVAAEGSDGVELAEVNGSGQAGTATVTPSAEAVGVSVEVESADVAQLALVARGNCAALEEPFATIEGAEQEPLAGTKSGHFETAELTILADGSPATLTDLQQGEFAILVIDATYRGGVVEEIPPDVQVFQGPDPEGPFGETPYPIAACGDVPAIG